MKCAKCGMELPDDSKFCGFCGSQVKITAMENKSDEKKEKKNKRSVTIAVGAVLIAIIIALAGYAIFLNNQLLDVKSDLASKETKIDQINSQYASLKNKYSEASDKAKEYDRLVNGVRTGQNGYATDHFHVDTPVVYVKKGNTTRVKLTAYSNSGMTVGYRQLNGFNVASVDLGAEKWTKDVDVVIKGNNAGVTVYHFYIEGKAGSFNLVIIVED